MDRRGFLAATAGSVAASGCLGRDDQLARLAWINIRNDRDEAYDVDVVVEEDGETVFSESYRLGTETGDAAVLEEDPVEGEGRYVVSATLGGERREVDTMDFIEDGEPCIGVTFDLLNNGSVWWDTRSMQEC